MRPFRNKGWKWLHFMEKILPVAGATGAFSFAAAEVNPMTPSLQVDLDRDVLEYVDHVPPQVPSGNDAMDIDSTGQLAASTSTSTSSNILPQPTAKRPRLDNDGSSILPSESGSANSVPTRTLSVPSDHAKGSRKTSEKKKGKARTASGRSVTSLSTSQCVDKVTPAVAIVELHGSIQHMTQAIVDASKPPETVGDKASVRCQDAVRLVQERDDGLSLMEKAALIVFFGTHSTEADQYIALDDAQLRLVVVRQWIGDV